MRRPLLALVLCAAVAVVIGVVVACGDTGFGPSYGLDGPRILAIRSEPVELVPNGQTTLDALVYVPPGSPAPTYTWSWCASLGATEQCATSAAALTAELSDAGAGTIAVDYSLGTAETAVFNYPIDPTIVTAACARRTNATTDAGEDDAGDAGDAGDASDASTDDASTDAATTDAAAVTGRGGLTCANNEWTIYILLTVKVGDRTLSATRDLTAYLTTPTTVNTNPTIEGLAPFTNPVPALDAGDPAADAAADEYATADAAAGSLVSSGLVLSALVPESSSELYSNATTTTTDADAGADAGDDDAGDDDDASFPDGGGPRGDGGRPDDNDAGMSPDAGTPDADAGARMGGGPRDMYEQLTLAWYVESGQLDSATTTLAAANEDDTNRNWSGLLVNRWTPPTGSPEFIVVIRDNRGGVGWIRQHATGR